MSAALESVPVPAPVTAFAAATSPGPGGPDDDVAEARARIAAALERSPRLVVCDGWARILVPPGSAAWTLGRTVLLRRGHWSDGDARTNRLVAHELVHVQQWGERGLGRFLGRYVADYLKARLGGLGHWDAYRAIPDEVEAYTIDAVAAPFLG